jgi:hypothetical protein
MTWDLHNWTPMSKSAFEGHLATIEDGSFGTKRMGELLDELVTAGQDWADETLLDVLRGRYGDVVRRVAVRTVEEGFSEGGAVLSFTRFCVSHKKVPLLAAVADLGLPSPGFATQLGFPQATTAHGRWLDILANVGEQRTMTSFARQVVAFAHTEHGSQLADILAKHDPGHRDIDVLAGMPGHEVIIEALMRSRIAAAPSTPSAARNTRHRRTGL